MSALILGLFAVGWFNWTPPVSGGLRLALLVGMAAAVGVAVVGAVRAFQTPASASALHDAATGRSYGRTVAVEFLAAGLGAAMLGGSGASAYIPVWVSAVVGVHFFPLARLFGDPAARWTGAAVCGVAVVALWVGLITGVSPSSVTGPGAGLVLLSYAAWMLLGSEPQMARSS